MMVLIILNHFHHLQSIVRSNRSMHFWLCSLKPSHDAALVKGAHMTGWSERECAPQKSGTTMTRNSL